MTRNIENGLVVKPLALVNVSTGMDESAFTSHKHMSLCKALRLLPHALSFTNWPSYLPPSGLKGTERSFRRKTAASATCLPRAASSQAIGLCRPHRKQLSASTPRHDVVVEFHGTSLVRSLAHSLFRNAKDASFDASGSFVASNTWLASGLGAPPALKRWL